MAEVKVWFSVKHAANGKTSVTCSMSDPDSHLSVRWAVQCYESQIKQGVRQAKAGAERALATLREAVEATQ